jgi:hypothetical protein
MVNVSSFSIFDTTSRWFNLTLSLTVLAIIISGIGIFLWSTPSFVITPVTLFFHLVWAICISMWTLNLRLRTSPEKKALLAVGTVVGIGSIWSSIQQWLAYQQNGIVNDLTLIVGAMLVDVIGGVVTYILYNANATRTWKSSHN